MEEVREIGTDTEKQGTELDTKQSEFLLDIFAGRVEPPPIDTAALNERITKAMLEAETPEEALRAGATYAFEDGLMGVPVEVRDIAFRPSTLAGDVKVYGLIDAYNLATGEDVIVTCSALQVLRTIAVYKLKGWLPAAFIVERSESKTAEGFTPYTIRAA